MIRRSSSPWGSAVRGATAGAAAAAVWAAAEPLAQRVFRTTHSDVRLLGRMVRRGPVAGLAIHLANGAAFGIVFERIGLRGARAGVVSAEVEHVALWPAVALVEPSLLRDRRVFVQDAAMHALFGAVLGALVKG